MTLFEQCALILALAALITAILALFSRGRVEHPAPRAGLVVLVRDQADQMEGVFRRLLAVASQIGYRWDSILLLDDGSRDETPEILARLNRRFAGVETRTATARESDLLREIAPPGQPALVLNLTDCDASALLTGLQLPLRAVQEIRTEENGK